MKLRTIKVSVAVLIALMLPSSYGAPSVFAKALRLAVCGDQKAVIRTIVDNDQGHHLRVIDSGKVPARISEDLIVDIGDAKFYVPNYPVDYVQSCIVNGKTFYENAILQELRSYIKENAVILDIGANIGNHSVYWAAKANAKRIYSFEPVQDTFKILEKNIQINELTDKVRIYNMGLSNEKINGSISHYDPKNIGATSIKQDLNGNLVLDKLDNIEIEEDAIDFVKIDVEGHELEVFQGARETLTKYRPTIFVETFWDKRPKVHEYLTSLGYRLEKSFVGENYLYIFDNIK